MQTREGEEALNYEVVHTVTDYWDQPRQGVADFAGLPHFYDRKFDEDVGEYTEYYYLTPIDRATLELAREQWRIWVRSRATWDTVSGDYPAGSPLFDDRRRYVELEALLKDKLVTDHRAARLARGEFRRM